MTTALCALCPDLEFSKWSELSHVLSQQRGWFSPEERLKLAVCSLVASDGEAAECLVSVQEIANLPDLEIATQDFITAFSNQLHVEDSLDPARLTRDGNSKIKERLLRYSLSAGKSLYRYLPEWIQINYDENFTDVPRNHLMELRQLAALIPSFNFKIGQVSIRPELGTLSFSKKQFNGVIDFARGTFSLVKPEFSEIFIVKKAMVRVNAARDILEIFRDRNDIIKLTGSGIRILSFTSSPSSDLFYLVYRSNEALNLLVCLNSPGECELYEPHHTFEFVEIDGDFMLTLTRDTSYIISLTDNALYSSCYPERIHLPDLKMTLVTAAFAVKDHAKDRLTRFFRIMCETTGYVFSNTTDELKTLSEICEFGRWSEIEKFISGKPYSEVALILRIQNLLNP